MAVVGNSMKLFLLLLTFLHRFTSFKSARAICEYSVAEGHKIYKCILASPISRYPHGVLSEDGIAVAGHTVAWVVVHLWLTTLEVTRCALSLARPQAYTWTLSGPNSLAKTGACDYATVLRHPSGCAETTHVHGKGWGCVVCLFGGYLLAGSVYRHFVHGVRGI